MNGGLEKSLIEVKNNKLRRYKMKHRKTTVGIVGFVCILLISSFMTLAPAYSETAAGKTRSCTLIDYNSPTIGAGITHIIALKEDGTVEVAEDYPPRFNVTGWTNIKAVAAGEGLIAGLREDGTVLSQGWVAWHPADTTGWSNITAIAAGADHIVGLKVDGTVIVDGYLDDATAEEISGWTNIKAVAGGGRIVGLKEDGTVVVAGADAPDVSSWRDIKAIAAEEVLVVGLKEDGTVVTVGCSGGCGESIVSEWTDIVAIAAGRRLIVGLKKDGTVVAAGGNWAGQLNVSKWKNITSIAAFNKTVGLKENGKVESTGEHIYDVKTLKNIKQPTCLIP